MEETPKTAKDKLDEIDFRILTLLKQRLDVIEELKATGIRYYGSIRKISKLAKLIGMDEEFAKEIFRVIIRLSRRRPKIVR